MVLVFMGILAWFTMPREEDPAMKARFGFIQAIHPGSPPGELERLVVHPIERELARVSEIKEVKTTIRAEYAILVIKLQDSVSSESEINEAWRNVENAMNQGKADMPSGVIGPTLDRNVSDLDAIVYAIHGGGDILKLYDYARELEKDLLRMDRVIGVKLPGKPDEEIRIQVDDRQLEKNGIGYNVLAGALMASNRALPGGTIRMDDRRVNVVTNSSFNTLSEIKDFPVILQSGRVLPISSIASVKLAPADPPVDYFYFNGERAAGLTVIPRKKQDLVVFGKLVRAKIDAFRQRHPELESLGIEISEVSYQPDYVAYRLEQLSGNLLSSMGTVALVVILGMGWKMGLLVSSLVPAIVISSLGIFATGGGVLNQISIAAFVMSLGILIDNVIVIVESIQTKMDEGEDRFLAARHTIAELALPLATATGTTVAAFLPMLGSQGSTADFTRAIPVIAILTLVTSYFFSILVTPSLSMMFLKKGKKDSEAISRTVRAGLWAGRLSHRYRYGVILFAFLYLFLAGLGFLAVRKKFFPLADRDQLTVTIRNPEGTSLARTNRDAMALYQGIKDFPEIENVSMFVGRGVPRFYYNVNILVRSPHLAQFIVDLDSVDAGPDVKHRIEEAASRILPTTMVIVNEMEQGPPIKAAIEVLAIGEDRLALQTTAEMIQKILLEIQGTSNVRNDMGIGSPGLRFVTGDANAMQYGVDRNAVTSILMARTRGIPIGQFRGEEEPIPIYLRSGKGEEMAVGDLETSFIRQTVSGSVLLKDLSRAKPDWQPSLIQHLNRENYISILSGVADGTDASVVMKELSLRLKSIELPPGVRLKMGGETGESGEANQAILAALPAGVGLFFISLLIEFRSFSKMGILLFSLPIAMTGVVPGLLLTGNPFGFLSLLGMLALVGIAVNNGILILDAVEKARSEGYSMEDSVGMAVSQRLRPILLTTGTTIFGLLPLALTSATLWPPFAWSIISGLGISALLSLFVIPALYSIAFDEDSFLRRLVHRTRKTKVGMILILPGILVLSPILSAKLEARETESIGFIDALRQSGNSPESIQASERANRADADVDTYWRSVYLPKVGVGYNYNILSSKLQVGTPIGPVGGDHKAYAQGALEVEQTLFDPGAMFYKVPAANNMAQAAVHLAKRKREEAMANVSERYFQVLEIQAKRESLSSLKDNLASRLTEIQRFYRFGRVSRVDLLRLQLAYSDAKSGLITLDEKEKVAMFALGQSLGRDAYLKPEPIGTSLMPGLELLSAPEEEQEDTGGRNDMMALEAELKAKNLEKEELEWWMMPVFFLKGSYIHDGSGQFTRNNWMNLQAGIKLPLFEAGTRSSRLRSVEARIRELEAARKAASLGIALQIENARVDYRRSIEEEARLVKNLSDAKSAAALARSRYSNGRAMLQEMMDAENILFSTDEKLRLVRIDRARSWVQLALALGQLDQLMEEETSDGARPGTGENNSVSEK